MRLKRQMLTTKFFNIICAIMLMTLNSLMKMRFLHYSVSKREIKSEDALIDRGANGSLIGDDTRKIASPAVPKFVNASVITPHQLTNIPIITA